jgi:5-methylcytosine-specific restriction endonuclease McrA
MFLKIWENLNKKECWSCSKYLGKEPLSYFFDHLLEKSQYPELDLEEGNIYIVCEECHTKKTNGFPTEKHKEAIMKAKETFLEEEDYE